MSLDDEVFQNETRLKAFIQAEENLKTILSALPQLDSCLRATFARFQRHKRETEARNNQPKDDSCAFYLILFRIVTGSKHCEEWRPGEPETYELERGESLLLTADITLRIGHLGLAVGDCYEVSKRGYGDTTSREPDLVPIEAWEPMEKVIGTLSRPISSIRFLCEALKVCLHLEEDIEAARRNAWSRECELQREVEARNQKLSRLEGLLARATCVKSAIGKQWLVQAFLSKVALERFRPDIQ